MTLLIFCVEARHKDEASYTGALKLYQQQLEQWQATTQLATSVLAGNTAALNELEPLVEMQEMGCVFEVSFPDAHTALVDLAVESESVFLNESKSMTRSSKLSVKNTPPSKLFEL